MAAYLQGLESKVPIEKLSLFLGHPLSDPHGEPIPDKNGKFQDTGSLEIFDLKINQPALVSGYRESAVGFLEYMEKLDLLIDTEMQVISLLSYDRSIEILIENKTKRIISKETAQKIYVRIITKPKK
jgi:DtxR family Mn-dependent transcriptional regulator